MKGDVRMPICRIPMSRTSKAESTVVSELDSECGTMYADSAITWDGPADVGNAAWQAEVWTTALGIDNLDS